MKGKIYLLWVLFVFFSKPSFSQNSHGFSKTINLPSVYFLLSSPEDSGFVLVDIYSKIVKFNNDGSSSEIANGIEPISVMLQSGISTNSGFVLSGFMNFASGFRQPVLVKLNKAGVIDWFQATDIGQYNSSGSFVVQANDGGYFTGGFVRDEVTRKYCGYVQKSDTMGISQWVKIYKSANKFLIHDISPSIDGGLIARTVTNDVGAGFMRLDSLGNILWAKSLEDSSFSVAMTFTKDQSFIQCGQNYVSDNLYAAKFDSTGILLWYREYIGKNCFPFQVIERKNGDIVFVGSTKLSNGFFLLTDRNGIPVYSKEITTDTIDSHLYIQNVIEQYDSSLVMFGRGGFTTNSFAEVLYKIPPNNFDLCYSMPFEMQNVQKNFIVSDDSVTSFFVSSSNYPVTYNTRTDTIPTSSEICKDSKPEIVDSFALFPNPASEYIKLSNVSFSSIESIEIFNLIGQKVFSKNELIVDDGVVKISINLPTGLYFLSVINNSEKVTFKVIVSK